MAYRYTAASLLALAAGAAAQSCSATVDALVGYGADATGGSSDPVTPSSCDELHEAAEAGGSVIQIDGVLEGCDTVRLASDTTIEGVGAGSGLTGSSLRVYNVDNIVIRNLELSIAPDGGDLIDIETSTNIWVDHNDLYNVGLEGGKDDYDGLLDIKRASDFVTVSWNKFHDHWKGLLTGHSASNGDQDSGTLHVTYHHNSFININSRAPSVRFGTAHIYSNCYEDIPTSGVNSRENAEVLVEANSFTSVRRAIVTDLDANDQGYAVERDNIFTDSDIDITQVGSFDSPPYDYEITSAEDACGCVEANGGTGVL